MSNKKTRKQKNLAAKRQKEYKIQLKALKLEALELQSKISRQKKENFKQFNIRNLKIFKNCCNFAMPFVVATGITTGLFYLGDLGLPFHLDEIVKYKVYSLDFQTNGYISMNEEYKSELKTNNLVVYTPWEQQNEQYIRLKREYCFDKITSFDLFNAVLDEDYNYILENLKEYKEEKQITNKVILEENGYFLEASLNIFDMEDTLKYNETDLGNIVVTIIELILILGAGGLITYIRDFDLLFELRIIKHDYISKTSHLKIMEKQLKAVNEKILSLKTGGRR